MNMPNIPPGPGRRSANPTPLVLAAVAVIVVCVVVLFALGSGGPAPAQLQAGDCVPANGDTAVPCEDADAAYRVIETRDGVNRADAQAACAAVPEVTAYGWQGDRGAAGTAYCLGPV